MVQPGTKEDGNMDEVRLPIDVVLGTDPPIFKWKQLVDTPSGKQVVEHQQAIPATIEVAVSRMVAIVKQLLHDNAVLRGQVEGMADRIAAQSELLGKKAESVPTSSTVTPAPHASSLKKPKG